MDASLIRAAAECIIWGIQATHGDCLSTMREGIVTLMAEKCPHE